MVTSKPRSIEVVISGFKSGSKIEPGFDNLVTPAHGSANPNVLNKA